MRAMSSGVSEAPLDCGAAPPPAGALCRWLPVALLLLAAALFLPGLGTGLWEPSEVAAAEAARSGRGAHPPLAYALQSAGLRLLGMREWAARLPVAISAIACMALMMWIGAKAFSRRAGMIAALVLVTSPAFLFSARQASSDMLAGSAGLAAWGGVLLIGRVPLAGVAGISAAGVLLGTLSGGVLVGAALPLCAIALALGLAGPRTRGGLVATIAVGALAAAACGLVAFMLTRRGLSATWLYGTARTVKIPPSFDSALKTLAHGAFPWSALVPVALLHLSSGARPSFARRLVLAVLAVGFSVALVASWHIREIRFPALAAVAMAIGVYLDDALSGEAGGPFAALLVACGAAILARDLFLSPESLLDAQRLEGLKYPIEVNVHFVHLGAGLAFAVAAWVGLGWWRKALLALFVLAVPYGAFAAHGLMPALGKHFSSKGLLDVYHRLAREGEPLAHFRVAGKGMAFQTSGDIRELRTQQELLEYLRAPGRVFALVPAADLASLDQAARKAGVDYSVLDDSSSRSLLISNKLGAGEKDKNPLRRFVFREPTEPPKKLSANFENMVELRGFSLPASVELGGKIHIALHFHVTGKLPPNWKLFVHFDQPAYRIHGDHVPLDGKLPTQHWSVGDYIIDEYDVDVPRMTTPKGLYSAFVGFWLGEKRLKVVEGPNDGTDRVRLGALQVK